MSHHDQGNPLSPIQFQKNILDFPPGFRIEIPRGFICEQDFRLHHQRPRNSDPLLLTTGKLRRFVRHPITKAHIMQYGFRLRKGVSPGHPADQSRHHRILEAAELRQQVVKLEDKADGSIPEGSQLFFRPLENIQAIEKNFSRSGMIQRSQDVDERCLPCPGNPQDCKRIPIFDLQIEPAENVNPLSVFEEGLFEVAHLNHEAAS